MLRYDREVRVVAGPPGAEGVAVDQRFRVAFVVDKTDDPFANRMTVDIYGLTRDTMERMGRIGNRLILEAGYVGDRQVLAIGNITRYEIIREPPEIALRLEASDGFIPITETLVSLSFDGPIDVRRIINEIASAMNVVAREVEVAIAGSYQQGWSFSGKAADALSEVTRKAGLSWSIQSDLLLLTERGKAVARSPYRISASTGMIRSPMRLEDVNDAQLEELGWRVDSLLLPYVEPGDPVNIESVVIPDGAGRFRVRRLQHLGDTRGAEWVTRLEAFEESDDA